MSFLVADDSEADMVIDERTESERLKQQRLEQRKKTTKRKRQSAPSGEEKIAHQ